MTEWTRRFTGSRLVSSFRGNDFPVTNSDTPPAVDLASWRLRVTGRVKQPLELTYEELTAMATATQTATVDCTLGWASTQEWRGVTVAALLAKAGADPAAQKFTCSATTGWYADIAPDEAQEALVATHVGGQALSMEHGSPARLVVPSRRGFHWVKWLEEIRVE